MLILGDTHVPARARDVGVFGNNERMEAAFPDTDLLVFGHSHIPWDSTTPAGLRLLNPRSPTDRRRQPQATVLRLTLDAETIGEPELLAVGP